MGCSPPSPAGTSPRPSSGRGQVRAVRAGGGGGGGGVPPPPPGGRPRGLPAGAGLLPAAGLGGLVLALPGMAGRLPGERQADPTGRRNRRPVGAESRGADG